MNGSVNTTTLNTGVEFSGQVVSPRNSVVAALDVRMPLFAAAQWARRTQAEDQENVAELSAAETRRQIALATADAYLSVIARRRVVEADVRARDTAKAHFDLASELEQRGSGSRLNKLRAQQELSTDDGLVESARLRSTARRRRSACCSSPTARWTPPRTPRSTCRPTRRRRPTAACCSSAPT